MFAGYVIWAFRGASLLVGALSTMPMWLCFDPLAVLLNDDQEKPEAGKEKRKTETDKDEEKVRELLDSDRRQSGQSKLQSEGV